MIIKAWLGTRDSGDRQVEKILHTPAEVEEAKALGYRILPLLIPAAADPLPPATYADPNIATVYLDMDVIGGKWTNTLGILIRPENMTNDESGEHKGLFAEVVVTREELRSWLAWLEEDWARQLAVTPEVLNGVANEAQTATVQQVQVEQ